MEVRDQQFSGQKLPKNVIWLSFASFFNDVSSEIVTRALPLFLSATLGVAYPIIGLIEGVADSTSSFLKIFSGWYSDRIKNRKRMTVLGYALTAAARPLLIGIDSWVLPLLARFIDRSGKGIRTAPRDALIADSVSHRERGRAFGFQRALDPLGAVVGSLIAASALFFFGDGSLSGEIITESLFNTLIYIAIFPTVISVLLIIFFVKEPPHQPDGTTHNAPFTEAMKHKRFRSYLIILLLFTLGSSSDAFLMLRAHSLGVSPAGIFVIFALLNLLTTVSSYPAGILSDRISRRKIIVTAWVVYMLVYLGFAFATEQWHCWALFIIYGIFYGLTEGVERALVADLVPKELRGTAYGLYNGVLGIGLLPASLIAGLLWQNFGASAPFLFGSAMALLSVMGLSRIHFTKNV